MVLAMSFASTIIIINTLFSKRLPREDVDKD